MTVHHTPVVGSRRRRGRWLLAGLTALALTAVPSVRPSAAAEATLVQDCVDSVPEPGSSDPVPICYTLYRPAGADAAHPVPMVLHSHGWGGSRTNDAGAFGGWMDSGFGVLSFDQRGFGESGGQAHIEHPDFEGQDVQELVDLIGGLEWVAKNGPGDPVLGSIGGSYGGGYQFVGAFTELRDRGHTRFDALAPEITWFDLKQSLAPSGVPRTLWDTVLYGAGASAVPTEIHTGFAYGAATGTWPDGTVPGIDLDAFFEKNGPAWHVSEGRRLDIPVLFGQGLTDNLFNLNQALQNFAQALTPAAHAQSIFVGYNGGHVLPSVVPQGFGAAGDPCSQHLGAESFGDLTVKFFTEELKGGTGALPGRGAYHLATADGECLTVDAVEPTTSVELGQLVTPVVAGPPQFIELADGPITIAGTSLVDTKVTTATPEARAFFALAVGTSATDARIVQHNTMPLREPAPVSGEARTIELPAVAVEVPEGQSLFLAMTPITDMFIGHASRVPGVIILDDTVIRLPVPHVESAGTAAGTTEDATSRGGDVSRSQPADIARGGSLPATGSRGRFAVTGIAAAVAALTLRRARRGRT